ncbi:hypothetical protein PDO_2654 [Rhizobium sp. PDO1-076]|uniref:hypothetical protein n=1 Tax=Rhizobium sp. PDO1-076 TaxID=1125979 RepID=UPI00024E3620|nr:hypothetical protein [Rhizobium sp. PDO1-076]EHS50183.1 hypothetical protein PDO_2654 [Rhizobium sp. PDO1-076]
MLQRCGVAIVLVLLSSPALANEQKQQTLCEAISSALPDASPNFPQTVNVGGEKLACTTNEEWGDWICNVFTEDQCDAAEGSTAAASATDKVRSELRDRYERTSKEVIDCFADRARRPLDYQKFVSADDAYVSKGTLIENRGHIRQLYVIGRTHVFAKTGEVCRQGGVTIEVQDPKNFRPFY